MVTRRFWSYQLLYHKYQDIGMTFHLNFCDKMSLLPRISIEVSNIIFTIIWKKLLGQISLEGHTVEIRLNIKTSKEPCQWYFFPCGELQGTQSLKQRTKWYHFVHCFLWWDTTCHNMIWDDVTQYYRATMLWDNL